MNSIWKIELEDWSARRGVKEKIQSIQIPRQSRVLHVAAQFDKPCAWIEVEEGGDNQIMRLQCVHTGECAPREGWEYVGTALCRGGHLACHYYIEKESGG